jgi:hypothetical protein
LSGEKGFDHKADRSGRALLVGKMLDVMFINPDQSGDYGARACVKIIGLPQTEE